jgi:protein transport protein SEC20
MASLPTLADLPNTLASLQRRLTDLETFQLPRLSACHGPSDLIRELSEEMRSDLEGVRRGIEVGLPS